MAFCLTQDWILSSIKKIHIAPVPPAFLVTEVIQSPGSTPSVWVGLPYTGGVSSRTGVVFDVRAMFLMVVLIIIVVVRIEKIP